MKTKRLRTYFATILFLLISQHLVLAATAARIISVNGDFKSGLAAWKTSGDVAVKTEHPLEGKRSVRIGPGAGSISQYILVGSDNHLNLSALLHSEPAGAGKLTIRFLDKNGRELMRVDSSADMKRGKNPDRIQDYLKPHPLTTSVEIVISKDTTPGYVDADGVSLGVYEENDPSLKTTENIAEAMRPIWEGNEVTNEAVLMLSQDGKPAMGTLMFKPMRILSVTDYGSTIQYQENVDFTVERRTVIRTPNSQIIQVTDADLLKGDLKWNVVGGKQILVTYEHSDAWPGPVQAYVGEGLPNIIQKLSAHEPLKIVACGDSITFGIGSSRILKIPPFQPPWIELFTRELGKAWNDPAITLYNSSQSGADSKWAQSMAERMVASIDPDLVVIAFGQNDFWRIPADAFASNISAVIESVRSVNPQAEFLLVSTMRFDPAYSSKGGYWDLVSQYESKLRMLTGSGVQLVDFTTISGAVFAAKAPKDCLNDPLHPNDYLSRWYAQSLVAALVPSAEHEPAQAPAGAVSKKGVGDDDRAAPEAIDALGVSWYYNWTARASRGNIHAQFVPMIWGREHLDAALQDAKESGAGELLGFNEPDGKGQADMTVNEAISLWPKLMATDMRLGSPATTTGAPWLDEFMTQSKAKHLRVDFLCLHWYGDITKPHAVGTLRAYLETYWERYHLPIWLTEYSGAYFPYHLRQPTIEDNAQFAAESGAMLKSLPFVERYAWFGTKWTPDWKEYPTVGLYDDKTRELTRVGIAYREIVSK